MPHRTYFPTKTCIHNVIIIILWIQAMTERAMERDVVVIVVVVHKRHVFGLLQMFYIGIESIPKSPRTHTNTHTEKSIEFDQCFTVRQQLSISRSKEPKNELNRWTCLKWTEKYSYRRYHHRCTTPTAMMIRDVSLSLSQYVQAMSTATSTIKILTMGYRLHPHLVHTRTRREQASYG